MHYRQFLHELRQEKVSPFYLITGEDDFLLQEGLKALRQAFLCHGGDVEFIDEHEGIKKVISRARGGDIFSPRKVIVWKNPSFLDNKGEGDDEELILGYAQKPASDVCLIVFAQRVDKRRRFYKSLMKRKQVYDFTPLKGRELAIWVRERARLLGKNLSGPVLEYLLLGTGENMAQIAGELEKIALYLGEEKEIREEDLHRLVSRSFNVNIFSLVDLLGDRKKDQGLFLLQQMLSGGEPPLKVLFMISRQLQLLYRVRSLIDEGLPARELSRHLTLAPFITQKLAQQVTKFQHQDLTRALKLVRETDHAIKTGRKTPGLALELLLLKL